MTIMNKEKYTQIKPPPPSNLDGKSIAIWASWSTMGEKEVAREAVMKGTHIELVKQFLSKKLDIDDTDKWFKNEIHCWVLDLLLRKQIYRAMHIFQNMGSDPFQEMLTIFLDTCCKELRQNVGNHLMKHEKLSESHINNWYLLNAIEEHADTLIGLKQKHISFNLNYINKQTDSWRNNIGTELFLTTFDFRLKVFINSRMAWTYLLKNNVDLLKYWINLYYCKTSLPIVPYNANLDSEILTKLNDIFYSLSIDEEMITIITDDEYCVDQKTQKEILNELSKYGVFNNDDRNNIIKIIKRLLEIGKISDIETILNQSLCNVDLKHFSKLLVDYCELNNLCNILNICCDNFIYKEETNSKTIDSILSSYNLSKNINDIETFRNNIFDTAKFLSKGNLLDYFSSYPLILLSIVIFTENVSVHDLLSKRVTLKTKEFEINKEVLLYCLKDYHYFVNFCNKIDGLIKSESVNYYELLKRHTSIRLDNIYNFRNSNEPLPNFNSANLIDKYGYKKELDFIYFLRNSRPMYAYKLFKLNYLDRHINENDYMKYLDKIYRVALRNFQSAEISTSSVAFLEILGENSYPLRLYLKSANIIFNSGKIGEQDIFHLFCDITANCQEIFHNLELSLIEKTSLDQTISGEELTRILKSHSILMKFSTLHDLKLPELFLKHCAQRDLWLPFLIYIQIYNYPVDLCCKLMQNFASKSLIEHLSHAISHDIQMDEVKNQLIGERDSRKYFLSRLGVRLTDSSGGSSDMSSHSSYGSMGNSIGSDFLESETLDYKTDLLEVLIKCHNSIDPPKALLYASRYYKCPLLAVLANSYEPDSVIMNWVTWLEVSCDIEETFMNYEGVITADSTLEMFRCVLRKNYFKTLMNGFYIFLPENPLTIFMEFLNEMLKFNFDINMIEMLELFHKKIKYWRSNSFMTDIDHDMTYFNNKSWIQNTAIFLLSTTLQHGFQSLYDQLLFLRFLNNIDIAQYFMVDFPDIGTYLKIIEYLYENHCEITFDLSVISNRNKYSSTIISYINELVDKELYEVALSLAKEIGISCDFILIKQVQKQFHNTSLRSKEFWNNWDETFQEFNITPIIVIENYLEFFENTEDKLEKFIILTFTFNWRKKYKLEDNIEVEKEMWLSYFQLDDSLKKLEVIPHDNFTLYSEYLKDLENIPIFQNVLSESEMQNFEIVIDRLLDVGDICTALRLERIFGCANVDLDILKLCLLLVEGLLLPHQLSARQRLLLNRRSNIKGSANIRRKTYTTPRISSCNSVTSLSGSSIHLHLSDNVVAPSHDTLTLLEMLVDNLKSGSIFASKIFKTYRISINLKIKYSTVLECKTPIEMLQRALEDDCRNKLEVVSDFIDIFKLQKEEIADLLYAEISTAITNYSISRMNICFLWDMNMDLDFNLILQLLPDNCSILGFKLYYSCSNEFTMDNLIRVTELLIRCHDCFTADCNMEGISMVLKKCKTFTSALEGMQDYNLIVRLLTGIARYTEMTYIFHILRQQEQFELLLRKGSRKDNGLRIALLEYLKKYCPDDVELYNIVALHFFLFSEIAELWEQEAIRYTQRIIALAKLEMQNYRLNPDTEPYILFINTEDNKKMLRKIMTKYNHAAEYHLHGQKLTKAMTAAKQAQLVALQLSLFKDLNQGATITCIFNLNNGQLNKLVLSDFSFQQSLIVIEAYNFEVDWASVLFEQYVVKDRMDFFQNFALSFPITENLVHDVSRMFLSSSNATNTMSKNMRTILKNLLSVHTKYRIASELGFTDILEELLNSHQLSYLKDTVWKSGYRNVNNWS